MLHSQCCPADEITVRILLYENLCISLTLCLFPQAHEHLSYATLSLFSPLFSLRLDHPRNTPSLSVCISFQMFRIWILVLPKIEPPPCLSLPPLCLCCPSYSHHLHVCFLSLMSVNAVLVFCLLCLCVLSALFKRVHGGEEVMWHRFCLFVAPGSLKA